MDLTADVVRSLLLYDPMTGLMTWRDKQRGQRSRIAGNQDPSGYRKIRIAGTLYWTHRLIWLYAHGEWPRGVIDHINGQRDDNRLVNLRDADRCLNRLNSSRVRSDSALPFPGIKKNGRGFAARITVGGKRRHLGTFHSPELAHAAYTAAKAEAIG